MSTNYNRVKVEGRPGSDTVTLYIDEVESDGWVKGRKQISFRLSMFEAALRDADVVIPWAEMPR